MGLFSWLFGGDKKSDTEVKTTGGNTKPLSEVAPSAVPQGATVIAQSEIPESCSIGNLVYEKKYAEAIELGQKLLEKDPDDCGLHVNLMDAYFKARDLDPEYFDKSTYHAKMAVLCGHHTGYAEERLAKNLDRNKYFHQSLQLYSLILDTKGFHFSEHGCGDKEEFAKRRESVLAKMDKAQDKETDILFTKEDVARIIKDIKEEDLREKLQKERDKRLNREMDQALKAGDYDKFDRLMKELHTPVELPGE